MREEMMRIVNSIRKEEIGVDRFVQSYAAHVSVANYEIVAYAEDGGNDWAYKIRKQGEQDVFEENIIYQHNLGPEEFSVEKEAGEESLKEAIRQDFFAVLERFSMEDRA